ncbi:hypothetical protein TNIN_271491 [Trichonephila inaurata madagascariensis]|uniref:Uncharacterized protein n=1 Tax=Trichonephila inaurata madagascariensis TaxID=2747483 RepID=A0A8X6YHQ6_9ARAC|nr:hypothetical protein TNIN_271491 [Trichonephila inaurata madagascariensis]
MEAKLDPSSGAGQKSDTNSQFIYHERIPSHQSASRAGEDEEIPWMDDDPHFFQCRTAIMCHYGVGFLLFGCHSRQFISRGSLCLMRCGVNVITHLLST